MVYPDSGTFSDRSESTATDNSSTLAGDLMVDPTSNEIYRLAQSKQNDDLSFLPHEGVLLSDLEDAQITSYSGGAGDDITIDPADQVSYPEQDQVSHADQNQVSYGDQDQVSYPEQEQVSYAQQDLVSVNETANDVEIAPVSTDANKPIADATSQTSDASYYQFADASIRPAKQYPSSEKDHVKIGALEYGLDAKGDVISIVGPRGEYFYKGTDGKWVEHMPPSNERTVENLTVDEEGNMEFDVIGNGTKAHHTRNVDGSHSVDSPEYGGTLKYDKDGNLIEAPAGDGKVRKFHYTNGQLDQIDGRLGHWERVEKDGKVSWKNSNGTVWEGEMKVNPKTNELEFRGRNGAAWNFTTTGKDVFARSR